MGRLGQFPDHVAICGEPAPSAYLWRKSSPNTCSNRNDTPLTGRNLRLSRVPDLPDSAVVYALSRVELGVDVVLDALRTPDPFGIRTILAGDIPDRQDVDLRQVIKLLWRFGRMLSSVNEVFEDRPRGGLPSRLLGKLPAVGVVGGFFDERKGIRRAAFATGELVSGNALA